jgi:hypothetical protein
MSAAKRAKSPANEATEATLELLSEAVESGSGLPSVARAAAKVLDAGVALIDRSSAVLAALILVGLVIGFIVFYNWDSIGG